jgi:hypothetical protein
MKKLSGNDAYAYIGQTGKSDAKTADQQEQVDSDDEDANAPQLTRKLLEYEAKWLTLLFHSMWTVKFSPNEEIQETELGRKLLTAFQSSINKWTVEAIAITIKDDQGEKPSEGLSQILIAAVSDIQLTSTDSGGNGTLIIRLTVSAELYDPTKKYSIRCRTKYTQYEQQFTLTPRWDSNMKLAHETEKVTDIIGTEYKAKWQSNTVVFKLESRSVGDWLGQTGTSVLKGIIKKTRTLLLDDDNSLEEHLNALSDSDNDEFEPTQQQAGMRAYHYSSDSDS